MIAVTQSRYYRDARALLEEHREKWPYAVVGVLCLIAYSFGHTPDPQVSVYKVDSQPNFKDGRVLNSQGESIYEGKERVLSRTVRDLMTAQAQLKDSNDRLQAKLESLEKGQAPQSGPSASALPGVLAVQGSTVTPAGGFADKSVRLSAAPEQLTAQSVASAPLRPMSGGSSRRASSAWVRGSGANIISFPVKEIPSEKVDSVVLPAGSYVKAKLMTGVEAPEGKTYPALLQLDYAYIVPNKHKLDLSGCFMIVKSQGDLSTERVQMQATKLSCVSKEGRMFERDVNGFIADDKDNSFAVMGSVNSKQDRVAAMAFLSSIAEGVGKAVQQSQTTSQTTPLGGSQSVVSGDQMTYMAAGGASNAASLVTQWYLKQAQNLLPTINVGSGQDVWIVMQDTVKLPNDYFKKALKGGSNEGVYSYFTRVLD